MSTKEWLDNIQEDYDNDWGYRGELESIKFTEEILQNIETNKIKKSDLAKRLKATPPYVSKILNSNCNFTLKTIYRICYALNLEFLWKVRPRKIKKEIFTVEAADISTKQPYSINKKEVEAKGNIYRYNEVA
jgi:transcriptional regulator with XRE-family HTH domain